MRFDDERAYDELLTTADAILDDEDFGVIAMDTDHRVVFYNRAESALSGLTPERVVGRHFFSEVAPCTNNFMVAYRFETEEQLDSTIDYVFTLRMTPTPVRLRLLRRPDANRRFLLVQRS
jgi:photoactive yellow protein